MMNPYLEAVFDAAFFTLLFAVGVAAFLAVLAVWALIAVFVKGPVGMALGIFGAVFVALTFIFWLDEVL